MPETIRDFIVQMEELAKGGDHRQSLTRRVDSFIPNLSFCFKLNSTLLMEVTNLHHEYDTE
jgi:hypothetical protein